MWIKSPRTKIIFDMDGVLMDSETTWHKAMDEFLTDHGVEDDGMKLSKKLTGKTEKESAKIIKKEYDLPHPIETIASNRLKKAEELHAQYSKPFTGAKELLSALEKKHYKTAVATSASREMAYMLLENGGLRQYLDFITTANDIEKSKPHPEIYHISAEKLCADPSECIVFEDSLHGIRAAKDAGMKVIAVRNGGIFSDGEYLDLEPVEIVNYISDITLEDIDRWSKFK